MSDPHWVPGANPQWTIAQIKDANEKAGQFFFSKGTMEFFDSEILPTVYEGVGGIYFVTSEQFHMPAGPLNPTKYSAPRKYTVRKFDPATGRVHTIGEHCKASRDEAQRRARRLARVGEYE